MTIKDILDTPISEMWSAISPFAIGYLIFYGIMMLVVLSFIVFVFIKVIKGHREFDKRRKERFKNRW
jgi:hypothetical protein